MIFYDQGADELVDGTYPAIDEGSDLNSEFSISKGKRYGSSIVYCSNGNIAFKADFEVGI